MNDKKTLKTVTNLIAVLAEKKILSSEEAVEILVK